MLKITHQFLQMLVMPIDISISGFHKSQLKIDHNKLHFYDNFERA